VTGPAGKRGGYLPFVDGLRALAILAVVGYHAFPYAVPGGFVGVDVFFVISGFLITSVIAREMQDGHFSFAQFFTRRARRLLPAATVCLLVVSAAGAVVLLPDALLYYGRSLLASTLMYANIFFYRTGGYFSAPSLEKPLLHTWSLAVEDQFYLTWPLLLLVLSARLPRKVLLGVVAAIALASLAYAQVKLAKDPEFAFFMLPTRAWELLLGALLALITLNGTRTMPQWVAEGLGVAGLAAVATSVVLLTPESDFPGLAAAPACLGTAAIIASGLMAPTLVTRLLALPAVVFIGLVSYSFYLWHWPIIALSSYRFERALTAMEAGVAVAIAFIVAVLSWRYVERPFRAGSHLSGGWRMTSDRLFVASALAGVLVVAGVAGAIKIRKGFPERYTNDVRLVLDQLVSSNPIRGSCDNYDKVFANDGICNFGRRKAQGESYELALFGDSMSDQWTPMAAELADEHQLAGRQVTNGGCALLVGAPVPATPQSKARECANYVEQARKFVAANPRLKVVIISGFWEKWLSRLEGQPTATGLEPVSTAGSQIASSPRFDSVLAQTVQFFTNRGIRVILLGQIPIYENMPLRCIVGAVSAGKDASICGMSSTQARRALARSNAALRRAAEANPLVSAALPSDMMCAEDRCSPMLDGTLLYRNGGHLNRFGALKLRPLVNFPQL